MRKKHKLLKIGVTMEGYNLKHVLDAVEKNGVEEWVHDFLNNEGGNVEFSKGLKITERHYSDLIKINLAHIERCCGPEQNMQFVIDEHHFEINVNKMVGAIRDGWQAPPLIINYEKGQLTLNDGNHRLEAFKRTDMDSYWAVVWTTEKQDYDDFCKKYIKK